METFALHLSEGLERHARVRRIINPHGKRALPLFLPYALAQATRIARNESIGDAARASPRAAYARCGAKKLSGM